MLHTEECNQLQAAWKLAVRAYETTWPKHCLACKGWGGAYSHYNPAPSGVHGSGTMIDFDTCPKCLDENQCPRCGAEIEVDDPNVPCPACTWTDKDPGVPEQPECICPIEE